MPAELTPEDVVGDRADWWLLLRRGLAKKCPRCGGGNVYDTWFRMKERCPTCGVKFEREPGFFVGAYFINFAVAEGFLFVLMMGFVFWKDQHPEAGVAVPIAIALVIAVVAPIVFYPFSRTIWSAIDIAMTPLELPEIVQAIDASTRSDPADRSGGPGPPDEAGASGAGRG